MDISSATSQVCGGYCGPKKLRSAERFDVLDESWEKLPMMLEATSRLWLVVPQEIQWKIAWQPLVLEPSELENHRF